MKIEQRINCLVYALCFLGIFCFVGCSSDSDSEQLHNGRLSAGEIVGLGFSTLSQQGYTDTKGSYSYKEGETICFHVGDILLGCTDARPSISIEDLVPETADDKEDVSVRIYQFLMSLDSYYNTYNSVHIDREVDAAGLGKTFDFVDSTTDVLRQVVEELLAPIYPGKTEYLVPMEHAKLRLNNAAVFAKSAGSAVFAEPADSALFAKSAGSNGCFATPLVIVTTASDGITVDLEKQAVDIYVINNPDSSVGNPINCLSDSKGSDKLSADAFNVTGSMRIRGCSTSAALKSQYSVDVNWPDPTDPPDNNPSHTTNFLGMTYGGNKWVFNDAGQVDPTLIRNPLSFYLQRELGKQTGSNAWAPRTKYFELWLVTDVSGEPTVSDLNNANYRGIYILMEDIHNGTGRIPINDWASTALDVGPLILQINHSYTTSVPGQYYEKNSTKIAHYQDVLSSPAVANIGQPLYMNAPNSKSFVEKDNYAASINQNNLTQIKQWFYTEDTHPYTSAPPYGWTGHFNSPPHSCLSLPPDTSISPSPVINLDTSSSCYGCTDAACFFSNLQKTTDFQSFVEYFLLNELVKDPDGYHKSTFMYKTADACSVPAWVPGDACSDSDIVPGKVFAGPLWDKNKSYGIYGGSVPAPCGVTSSAWADPTGFLYCAQSYGQAPWWWSVFLLSDDFKTMASNTWKTATAEEGILTGTVIGQYITEQSDYLFKSGAIQREVDKWGGLAGNDTVDAWKTNVTDLENWIYNGTTNRLQWLNDNFDQIGIETNPDPKAKPPTEGNVSKDAGFKLQSAKTD